MAVIQMRRISRNEKAVRGSMRVNGRDIATLENADYLSVTCPDAAGFGFTEVQSRNTAKVVSW